MTICTVRRKQKIIFFKQVQPGRLFASTRTGSEYEKLDEDRVKLIHQRDKLNDPYEDFDPDDLVYVDA